jgi:multidrug efflux pump subunit AcrA (membrane-fusion protein)
MKKRTAITVLAGCSLLLVSCTSPEHANTEARRTVRTETQIVHGTEITDYFEAPGTVKAKTQTVLSSKVMGNISSLSVREGDRVRSGEVLVEVEGRDAAAQLRRAQAAEAEASRSLDEAEAAIRAAQAAVHTAETNQDLALTTKKRYDTLRERHSISPQEFDEVDARYKAAVSETERARESLGSAQARRSQTLARIDQAEAEVEAARVTLGYLKIVAPINGIVTSRQADPGMLAGPGMPLLTIEDDETYQLHSMIEESRAGSVHAGEDVSIQIDGLGQTVEGRVAEIVPASDPSTRTYVIKIGLSIPREVRGRIHSGFFGRALIPAGNRQALLVPESALVQRGQLTGIYVVQNNNALLRLVKTGKRYDKDIEVLSGLNEGVRIVSKPDPDITDGVSIIEAFGGVAP